MWQSIYRGHREIDTRKDKRTLPKYTACSYTTLRSFGARQRARHLPIWNEIKFIDRDPDWYTGRVKEAIHAILYLNNNNSDSGIGIPEA